MADIDPLLAERTGQTLAELQELKEIFQLVDLDHGGTISRSELETLMKTVGLSTSNNDMQLLMSEIDPTGSGEIDFEGSNRRLDQYDECHDGTISMKCLFQAFTKWSPAQMSEEDARELIKEVAPQSETQFFDYQQFLSIYFGDA
ncbi:hypothetical protein HDU91_003076 [Kappamyces sp. JEL0680]|nr:hypothetical protein HDU91_003076 [Kappamyces sp. JEL0680]